MSDTTGDQSGAFARAFLPGLVLGLVIGGVCGAILPTLLESRPKIERSDNPSGTSSRDREEDAGSVLDQGAIDQAIRDAEEQGEDLLDEGAEKVDEAVGDLTDPPASDD